MACDKCKRGPVPIVEVEKGHFIACHFANMLTKEKRKLAEENTVAER
jgi:hypothetical protein